MRGKIGKAKSRRERGENGGGEGEQRRGGGKGGWRKFRLLRQSYAAERELREGGRVKVISVLYPPPPPPLPLSASDARERQEMVQQLNAGGKV